MKILSTILLALLCFCWCAAADANSDFDAANALYAQGKYTEAAAAYEQILSNGQANATLWYNLGNARFKAGEKGRAVAAYRHAERLSPRDPDIRANLQFARQHVSGNDSVTSNVWQRTLGKLTLNEWALLAAVALWAWLITLAAREWIPDLRPRLARFTTGMGLLTLVLGGCTGSDWLFNHSTKTAVIIGRDVVAKAGPLEDSQNAFTPKDGTELSVLDERDDWLQVTDAHQRIGWVRRDSAEVF